MKTFTLLTSLFISINVIGQNPVLNQSFENWTAGRPDNWFVTSPPFGGPVTQVADAYAGSSALRGYVGNIFYPPGVYSAPGGMQGGFPINQKHFSLTFYYKFIPAMELDAMDVLVNIRDSTGTVIGSGQYNFYDSTNVYTFAEVPITYFGDFPTNMEISFTVSNPVLSGWASVGTWFQLDDLSMTAPVGVSEITNDGIGNIYPNPSTDEINIPFFQKEKSTVSVSIFNNEGKLIRNLFSGEKSVGQFKIVEPVSDLPNGTYQCIFRNGEHVQTSTFQIIR